MLHVSRRVRRDTHMIAIHMKTYLCISPLHGIHGCPHELLLLLRSFIRDTAAPCTPGRRTLCHYVFEQIFSIHTSTVLECTGKLLISPVKTSNIIRKLRLASTNTSRNFSYHQIFICTTECTRQYLSTTTCITEMYNRQY